MKLIENGATRIGMKKISKLVKKEKYKHDECKCKEHECACHQCECENHEYNCKED